MFDLDRTVTCNKSIFPIVINIVTVLHLTVSPCKADNANLELGHVLWELSSCSSHKKMLVELYMDLMSYMSETFPTLHFHASTAHRSHLDSKPLFEDTLFFDHVLVQGHQYYAASLLGSKRSCFIEVNLSRGPAE